MEDFGRALIIGVGFCLMGFVLWFAKKASGR